MSFRFSDLEKVKLLWLSFDSWWQLTRGEFANISDEGCWDHWLAYAKGHAAWEVGL